MTVLSGQKILADHVAALQAPPIAELRQTGAQTLTTGVWTSLTFDAEVVDSAGGHSTSSNTSRYTAVIAGYYLLSGGAGFASNATGLRGVRWAKNGSSIDSSGTTEPTGSGNNMAYPARGILVQLSVGDYVELQAVQTTGGNLGTSVAGYEQSGATITYRSE